jgi:histone-binding protein RBBP4
MPQNHFILATRGPSSELYIWDTSKHPSIPDEKVAFCPQGVCMGHEKEGYAMAWSPHTAGHLLSGSEDTTVKLWDVSAAYNGSASAAGTQIMATSTFLAHSATVEDVAWHAKDVHLAGSVGDDKRLCLWDVRDPVSAVQNIENAHESDINCLAFNPVDENLLATGCEGTLYTTCWGGDHTLLPC